MRYCQKLMLWSKMPAVAYAERTAFYLLNECGGINYRKQQLSQEEKFSVDDLYRFYNPIEHRMKSLLFWGKDRVMLLDLFGQVDVILPRISKIAPDIQPLLVRTVRSHLEFDRQRAVWYRDPTTVAFAAFEEAETLVQLKSNGQIQVIVMPQGARVFFDDRSKRIDIP